MKRIRQARHEASTAEMRDAYKIFISNPEGIRFPCLSYGSVAGSSERGKLVT
jgi:hypothetical protein